MQVEYPKDQAWDSGRRSCDVAIEESGIWASGFYGLSRSIMIVIPSTPGFTG